MASFTSLTRGFRQGRNPKAGDAAEVSSFNTRTGAVSLSKADVTGTGLAAGDVGAEVAGLAALKAANLSDLASAASARANLGLIPLQALPPTGVAATDTANLTAAFNAVNATAGAELRLPSGTYAVNSALPQITSPVNLHGSVSGIVPASKAGTVISFTAGVPGLSLGSAAQYSRIASVYLKSASSVLGTDDGIASIAHGTVFEQVVCDGFGRDGINIDTASGNANNSVLRAVRTINSQRHGFYLAGANSNVITFEGGCDASGNAGWGYYLNGTAQCVLIAPHASGNTLGAYQDSGNSTLYVMPYSEGGTGNNVTLSGNFIVWLAGGYSTPTLTYTVGHNNAIFTQGRWNDALKALDSATGHEWRFNFGSYAAGAMSLADQTNSTNIFNIDASDTRFEMLIPLLLSGGVNGTTTGTAPAAGGAGALPATPAGYLTVKINGSSRQVPYY